jgi:lysophospholipase L1-like esterase
VHNTTHSCKFAWALLLTGAFVAGSRLAAEEKQPAYDVAADEARKAKMAPEELAWEEVLEENLGSFYLPGYKQAKLKGSGTAWDYVKDDPKLPRVLLIGDSISRGYTLAVRQTLAGKVNVHRAPANCGPTTMGLQKLPVWLGDGKWDLIHFNFGIHDRNSKPEDYQQHLEQLVEKLLATGAKLVWASSTPLSGKMIEPTREDPVVNLNAVAAAVMKKHGIPVDDLHSVATPILATMQGADGCHFSEKGYDVLGSAVAACLLSQLRANR